MRTPLFYFRFGGTDIDRLITGNLGPCFSATTSVHVNSSRLGRLSCYSPASAMLDPAKLCRFRY